MSKIITIGNQKGGVGKTTVALSLMGALNERGFRSLGVDMDPQGSLGFSAGLDIENSHTIYEVFKGVTPIREAIVPADMGDFLLSNILLSSLGEEFSGVRGREFTLRNLLSEVSAEYDYIIIDTPPGLSFLTTNAYACADGLIIPTKASILEVLAVSQIRETIREVQASLNPTLRVLGILINMFDSRVNLGRDALELMNALAAEMDTRVFEHRIRAAVSVAEAPAHGESIMTYDRSLAVAQDFRLFTAELLSIM